jgi:hypothetical protein
MKEDLFKIIPHKPNFTAIKEMNITFNKIEQDLIKKKKPEFDYIYNQAEFIRLIFKKEFTLKSTISEGYLYEPDKYVTCTRRYGLL